MRTVGASGSGLSPPLEEDVPLQREKKKVPLQEADVFRFLRSSKRYEQITEVLATLHWLPVSSQNIFLDFTAGF